MSPDEKSYEATSPDLRGNSKSPRDNTTEVEINQLTQTDTAYLDTSIKKTRKRGHNSLVVDTKKSSQNNSKEKRELRVRI